MSLKGKLSLLYYQLILSRFDESSLKTKIVNDSVKFFFIFFILMFIITIFIKYFFFKIHIDQIFNLFFLNIFFFLIFIVLIEYVAIKTLKKHIFDRFEIMRINMGEIRAGDYSKRIEVQGSDEIAKMAYFTNEILNKLETQLEIEKGYSLIDPLTSCYNRRALSINFDLIKKKSKRNKNNFVVVILDLDFFKKINDAYGHKVGDDVLVNFVKIIKETIREEDFLYRIGGEEFVLLLTQINKVKTKKILGRLKNNIPYKLKKKLPNILEDITVSGGVIFSRKYDLDDDKLLDLMLENADELLYKAKKQGRNRILG